MKPLLTILFILFLAGCQSHTEIPAPIPEVKSLEIATTSEKSFCKTSSNTDPNFSNSEIYTNSEYGFQLEIPFTPEWGDLSIAEADQIEEHESALEKFMWGPMISDPHLGCTRPFKVLITEPRTVEQAIEHYWSQEEVSEGFNGGFVIEPTNYIVNDIQIAEFIANGTFCQQGAVEVFTPNFNLYFTMGCEWEKFHDQFRATAQTLILL